MIMGPHTFTAVTRSDSVKNGHVTHTFPHRECTSIHYRVSFSRMSIHGLHWGIHTRYVHGICYNVIRVHLFASYGISDDTFLESLQGRYFLGIYKIFPSVLHMFGATFQPECLGAFVHTHVYRICYIW